MRQIPRTTINSTENTEQLTDYAGYVTYRVSQLSAKMNVQASRLLHDTCGLKPVHWRLLALIYVSAPVTSTVLVNSIAMDAGQFSRNLKILVKEGMIKSVVDKNDNRRQVLSLTSKGLARYRLAEPIMKKRREALMKGIPKSDKEAFFRVLDKLDQNLSDHETNDLHESIYE